MAIRAQKMEIIFIICLINLLFNGSTVLAEKCISPFTYPAEGLCRLSECAENCNKFGYSEVMHNQPIPEVILRFLEAEEGSITMMTHLCVNQGADCACSVQLSDIWNQGLAINNYEAEDKIPRDDGQKYTYDSCVDLCYANSHEESFPEGFLQMTEIRIHLVVDNVCYCRAHPVFAEKNVDIELDPDSEDEEMAFGISKFNEFEDRKSESYAESSKHGAASSSNSYNANPQTAITSPTTEVDVEPMLLTDDDSNPDSP